MASATTIPVREYLRTSYRPDCDYVDGELQERNVGELSHGMLQGIFFQIFNAHRKEWQIRVSTETRVQTAPNRFRVPDVCVTSSTHLAEEIVQTAPLVCIEILSPEDRVHRLTERFADYSQMGVEHLWLIDPLTRHAWTISPDGSQQRVHEAFAIEGTPIRIDLAHVFAELDDMMSQG